VPKSSISSQGNRDPSGDQPTCCASHCPYPLPFLPEDLKYDLEREMFEQRVPALRWPVDYFTAKLSISVIPTRIQKNIVLK